MDCYRCLDGVAKLAKLTYRNGDIHEMFLCESCVQYFEAADGVRKIALAQVL